MKSPLGAGIKVITPAENVTADSGLNPRTTRSAGIAENARVAGNIYVIVRSIKVDGAADGAWWTIPVR